MPDRNLPQSPQPFIQPGVGEQWQPTADDFTLTSGGIIAVPAGAGTTPGQIIMASRGASAGTRIWLESIALVIPSGSPDQILWSVNLNGRDIPGFSMRNAAEMQNVGEILIRQRIKSGLLQLIAFNITGTTLPGAANPGGPINVVITLNAWLESQIWRSGTKKSSPLGRSFSSSSR